MMQRAGGGWSAKRKKKVSFVPRGYCNLWLSHKFTHTSREEEQGEHIMWLSKDPAADLMQQPCISLKMSHLMAPVLIHKFCLMLLVQCCHFHIVFARVEEI